MGTAVTGAQIAEPSPRSKARIAGFFYLLVIVGGLGSFVAGDRLVVRGDAAATAANVLAHEPLLRSSYVVHLLATACYVVVTALFYDLFKPVSRSVSLIAAFFSLVGCAIGALSGLFQLAPLVVLKGAPYLSPFTSEQLQALGLVFLGMRSQASNLSIVFFGFYCLLVGYLVFESTFLPRIVGVLMALAGLGWLTFLWAPLSNRLIPYNLASGLVGEGALTVCLLVFGVNVQRWKERAGAAAERGA
jgi:hypothetical protein